MPHPSLADALSATLVSFTIYVVSLVAALGINDAARDTIKHHDYPWVRPVYALVATMIAVGVITIIARFYHADASIPNDSALGRIRNNAAGERIAAPVVGRM